MTFQQKPNEGSLFKNKKKKTSGHPDLNGDAKIICPACGAVTHFNLSAWRNTIKTGDLAGEKYYRQTFKPKDTFSEPVETAAEEEDDFPDL